MSKSKSPVTIDPTAGIDTLPALAVVAKAGGIDPAVILARFETLTSVGRKREFVDTVASYLIVGLMAIAEFTAANPDEKVTQAAVKKHIGTSAVPSVKYHGYSNTAMTHAWDAAQYVILTADGRPADEAEYEAACEDETAGLSPVNAVDYITWRAHQVNPERSANRKGAGKSGEGATGNGGKGAGRVTSMTITKKERDAAIDRMAKADVTAPVATSAPITWAQLRLVSDDDLKSLLTAVTAEMARRERDKVGADAPSVAIDAMPDFTKMTKAQILAWQQSLVTSLPAE